MNIGDKIRYLRERRNLTQDQLAGDMGLARSSIGMYERNERHPNFELLVKFADYFNVTTDFILGRTENEHGIVVETKVDGHDLEYHYDSTKNPQGSSPEEQKRVAELAKELYELLQKQK